MRTRLSKLLLAHLFVAVAALTFSGLLYMYSGDADLFFVASPFLLLSAVMSVVHWFDERLPPAEQ